MTSPDQSKGDRARDEVLAGEYVLGMLSLEARRKVEARMVLDRDFAAMVGRWQANLESFNAAYGETPAPDWILQRVEERLHGAPARGGLWSSLAFWRGVAFASLAAVAVVGASTLGPIGDKTPSRPLVAELSGENAAVNLIAEYDQTSGRLKMTPVASGQEKKSLELWLIDGDEVLSLGVLPQTGEGEMLIPADMRARMGEGVSFAISLEQYGGSPTGKAQGPIVAAGPAKFK